MMTLVLTGYRRERGSLDTSSVAAFALVLAAAQFSGDFYDSRGLFLFSVFSLIPPASASGHISGASPATHSPHPTRPVRLAWRAT